MGRDGEGEGRGGATGAWQREGFTIADIDQVGLRLAEARGSKASQEYVESDIGSTAEAIVEDHVAEALGAGSGTRDVAIRVSRPTMSRCGSLAALSRRVQSVYWCDIGEPLSWTSRWVFRER